MKSYEIHRTPIFDRKYNDLSDDFKKQIDKIENQLIENPYVGKPLGMRWFREKKLENYRIYYLIYEDLDAVYIITLSKKKDQQRTINTIDHFLEKYREEIESLIDKEDIT